MNDRSLLKISIKIFMIGYLFGQLLEGWVIEKNAFHRVILLMKF